MAINTINITGRRYIQRNELWRLLNVDPHVITNKMKFLKDGDFIRKRDGKIGKERVYINSSGVSTLLHCLEGRLSPNQIADFQDVIDELNCSGGTSNSIADLDNIAAGHEDAVTDVEGYTCSNKEADVKERHLLGDRTITPFSDAGVVMEGLVMLVRKLDEQDGIIKELSNNHDLQNEYDKIIEVMANMDEKILELTSENVELKEEVTSLKFALDTVKSQEAAIKDNLKLIHGYLGKTK